jgi:hypothetical protein
MKKRLPTIVVFGGTLLVGLFIMLWPSLFPPQKKKDSDMDGFVDNIDKCDNDYSKTNNGCPEPIAKNGNDLDGDGYFSGFQKDPTKRDSIDDNPCIPNKNCEFCDLDTDGLNFALENQKGSDPENPDSDGDGVKDGQDKCVNLSGVAETNGCPIVLEADLGHKGNTISWNPKLVAYTSNLQLTVYDMAGNELSSENVTGTSKHASSAIKIGRHYTVKLKATVRNPKGVSILNTTHTW